MALASTLNSSSRSLPLSSTTAEIDGRLDRSCKWPSIQHHGVTLCQRGESFIFQWYRSSSCKLLLPEFHLHASLTCHWLWKWRRSVCVLITSHWRLSVLSLSSRWTAKHNSSLSRWTWMIASEKCDVIHTEDVLKLRGTIELNWSKTNLHYWLWQSSSPLSTFHKTT